MGEPGMNEFKRDDAWQKDVREKLLKPFYEKVACEGRYVFVDQGPLAEILQKEFHIDTIIQRDQGRAVTFDEKIVRWPGYEYTAFTLETMSCTVEGRESPGWMHMAQCDYILYCFLQADGSAVAYSIPFKELNNWFFENDRYMNYSITRSEQLNKTECRVVPVSDVLKAIPSVKRHKLESHK